MKKILVFVILISSMTIFSLNNQSPIIYDVKKVDIGNSIGITFKLYDRENDNLQVIIINNKTDHIYSKANRFIYGDIGNVKKKKQYKIVISNQNLKEFFPILLCYDGNSYGTEMIKLRKTKEYTLFISKYETMNIQFNEFVQIGGYSDESNWHIYDKAITLKDLAWRYCTKYEWTCPKYWNFDEDPPYKDDTYSNSNCSPVVGVSWWEALAYIKWIDGDIMSRDDWATIVLHKKEFPQKNFNLFDFSQMKKPYFNVANLRFSNSGYEYKGFNYDGYKYTAPVGSFPPIIYNGQKIYDLIGNVFEWTKDVVKVIEYPQFTCADRYIIGGSYKSNMEQMTYPIIGLCPLYRTEAIGFRYEIKVFK